LSGLEEKRPRLTTRAGPHAAFVGWSEGGWRCPGSASWPAGTELRLADSGQSHREPRSDD